MMNKIKDKLAQKLATLPQKPGVYMFRDKANTIIYIGKAKRLRNRVRSYFRDSRHEDAKLEALRERIHSFEYILTNSEIEALILEAQLIKEHKPRFNIALKDDKRFPLIKITNETFPRVVIRRKIAKDGAKYFGPYTDSTAMRRTLRTIRKIFPLRTCNSMGKRPCLNYHINRCLGPCRGEEFKEEYQQMVEKVAKFLSGRTDVVLDQLKTQMMEASENQEYERAARLRDQIKAIEKLNFNQRLVDPDKKDRDVIAIAADGDDACALIMEIREGKLLGKTHYFLTGALDSTPQDIFTTFIRQYYLNALFIPDEIILQHELDEEDTELFSQWLSDKKGKKVAIINPERGKKVYLMNLAEKNATLILEERKMIKENYKQRVTNAVIELQKELRLRNLPRVIEAFDISNIQGTDAVGAMVYFENGKPKKGEYRRFKIKTVEERPNDFAMMKEVVTRRYRDLLERKADFPDLILVDGGKGQLSSAVEALEALGVKDQAIIGLAKRLEEVFVPNLKAPIMIRRSSPALKLLQRVRDAVHDHAISYHRKLRGKKIKYSELDKIPGVGDRRKMELLKHFGSVKRIKKASVEELADVRRIPINVANNIWNYFHQTSKD